SIHDLFMKGKRLLKALKKYSQLNVKIKNENIFDLLNESIALIAKVPLSTICLYQGNEIELIANYGSILKYSRLPKSSYEHLIKHNSLEIEDIEQDAVYREHPGFIDNKIRFYATYPFSDSDGVLLGSINLFDYRPRTLNDEQRQYILKATQRASQITIDRRNQQVSSLLEILFDSTDDLIVVSNREKILHINPGVTKLLGYNQQEILNSELTHYFHPDDVHSFEEIIKNDSNGSISKKLTNRLVSKSGKIHH